MNSYKSGENESGHPLDSLLRKDRMPHIWCSGCGLGVALNVFISAILHSSISPNKFTVVSGIGCTGRVAGYLKLDSFHTTHGRAVPFATGIKLARPDMKVIVFSGEGDLAAIGGNHFIHAARRNIDMTVICVNNSNYGMTGGQAGPTTPINALTSSTPYGNFEFPFSLPYLAAGSGAVYVARWTVYNVKQLENSIRHAILKRGFSFIEIISNCPTLYGRGNKIGDGFKMMEFYKENTIVNHQANLKDINIVRGGKITVGDFIDIERPTFRDLLDAKMSQPLEKGKVFRIEDIKKMEQP
ncbi:MAG: 2-oxoacid:ferredoxin oxidoreductase subunit beta [Planctomycetota bacterium]